MLINSVFEIAFTKPLAAQTVARRLLQSYSSATATCFICVTLIIHLDYMMHRESNSQPEPQVVL